MGTSQGLTLKQTPQWSSAKRAMTGLLNDLENDAKLENFMLKFYQALGSDGIYIGTTTSGSSSGGTSTRGSGGGGSSSRDSRGGGSKGRRSFGRAGASADPRPCRLWLPPSPSRQWIRPPYRRCIPFRMRSQRTTTIPSTNTIPLVSFRRSAIAAPRRGARTCFRQHPRQRSPLLAST